MQKSKVLFLGLGRMGFHMSAHLSKSKNIDQNSEDNVLELLAIESYKKENNNEIVLLFSNNGIINLFCEIIECTLEDVKVVND